MEIGRIRGLGADFNGRIRAFYESVKKMPVWRKYAFRTLACEQTQTCYRENAPLIEWRMDAELVENHISCAPSPVAMPPKLSRSPKMRNNITIHNTVIQKIITKTLIKLVELQIFQTRLRVLA